MSAHHDDGAPERLERLLDGAPPRDETDRDTLALFAAIRGAEPPAPEALRERIAALSADEPRPSPWWRRLGNRPAAPGGTPRRRALWIAAPVAAAALAAAVVIPTVTRDGTSEQTAASTLADASAAPTATDAVQEGTAPMAEPEAASEAAPARAGQPAGGLLRVRVADRAALAAVATRAVAAVEALGGRRVAGHTTPRAGARRIVLVTHVPAGRVDDALTALGALGAVTAQRPPEPDATAPDVVTLRVVFEAPAD